MDQVQNGILQVMQAVTANAQAANKNGAGKKDEFRKLMDGQRKTGVNDAQAANPKGEAVRDGEVQEVSQEDTQLQERMVLAAAMLQNPVIEQVQEIVETVEVQAGAETAPVEEITVQVQETVVETAPEEVLTANSQEEAVQTAETAPQAPETRETEQTQAAVETVRETVESVKTVSVREDQTAESDDEEEPEDGTETAVFRDLKAVPVKVGETETAERTQEARPVETQIGEKLAEALKNGETRVEIQLTPENLGKVTIEVTVREDGSLRVNLHAELSQTRDLLARDLGTLQSALARNTQQDVRVEVRQQEEQRNLYDGQQGHEGRNSQQQRRENRQGRENTEDFLHQLRLGLIPEEGE